MAENQNINNPEVAEVQEESKGGKLVKILIEVGKTAVTLGGGIAAGWFLKKRSYDKFGSGFTNVPVDDPEEEETEEETEEESEEETDEE